jgi:hypothetical protein
MTVLPNATRLGEGFHHVHLAKITVVDRTAGPNKGIVLQSIGRDFLLFSTNLTSHSCSSKHRFLIRLPYVRIADTLRRHSPFQ